MRRISILFLFITLTNTLFSSDNSKFLNYNNFTDSIFTLSLYPSPLNELKRRWGPEINFGIESGLNFSNIKKAGSKDTKISTGFYGGGFIILRYDETASLFGGVLFSSKGYKLETKYPVSSSENRTDKFTMQLSYIDIPVKLRITLGEKLKINIEPGIYGSILLSAKQIGQVILEKEGELPVTGNVNEDASEYFRKYDYGLGLSAGVEYPLTAKRKGTNYHLFATTGYDLGLASISSTDLATLKNRNIRVGFGLIIRPE